MVLWMFDGVFWKGGNYINVYEYYVELKVWFLDIFVYVW